MFVLEPALLFVFYSVLKLCIFRSSITHPGKKSDSVVIQTDRGMCFVQQGMGCSLIIAVSFDGDSSAKSGN